MILETERLILREMVDGDYDALYTVLADSDIMRHYPFTFDEKRVRNWIFRNRERYRIYGFGLWAVCLKDTGEMIGDCGLTMQNIDRVIRPEIGYHIRRDMQRKGYAREAAEAVRDWAFRNLPFREIYSYMTADNEHSARCAASWGCLETSPFTDENGDAHRVFVMTKDRWEQLKAEDVWREMYERAAKEYRPGDVSPFVYAHHVVAAVETMDGRIFTGFCIESCGGVMNLCAERAAALNMYAQSGETRIRRMIAFRDQPPCGGGSGMPCGACREFLLQLDASNRFTEIMVDYASRKTVTLGELMPSWWGWERYAQTDEK